MPGDPATWMAMWEYCEWKNQDEENRLFCHPGLLIVISQEASFLLDCFARIVSGNSKFHWRDFPP